MNIKMNPWAPALLLASVGYGCLQLNNSSSSVSSATASPSAAPSPVTGKLSGEDLSVQAYTTTVYPVFRAHCVGCHSSTQSPLFASGDPKQAQDDLISAGKVNFLNTSFSRIVQRLSVDMHNCWTDCAADSQTMKTAVDQWVIGRGAQTVSLVQSSDVLIPTLSTQPVQLTFKLDSLFTPALSRVTLQVSVAQEDAYSYRFFSPKIFAKQPTAIYVQSLDLLLNGLIQSDSTTYRAIDQIVMANTQGVQISNASLILLMINGSGADRLSIGFKSLSLGGTASQRFTTANKMIQTECASCHSNTTAPFFGIFTTEADFLNLSWKGSPIVIKRSSKMSLLYQVVNGNAPSMPPNASASYRMGLAPTLSNWIDQIQ